LEFFLIGGTFLHTANNQSFVKPNKISTFVLVKNSFDVGRK
jgi:hypothetical protein